MNGEIIKNAREKMGVSQEKLSERCGIDRTRISKIENGKGNPTLHTIVQLAQGLDMIVTLEPCETSAATFYGNGEHNISILNIKACHKAPFHLPENIIETVSRSLTGRRLASHNLCVKLWDDIISSGILDANPEAIRLTISNDYEEAFYDCIESLMNLKDYTSEDYDLFGSARSFGWSAIADRVYSCPETGEITVEFIDGNHTAEIIAKALSCEKKKIAEAKKYLNEHTRGFDFLVFEPTEINSNEFDISDPYDIVTAWTLDEAILTYLSYSKNNRISDYYNDAFVRDFAEMLWDGIDYEYFAHKKELKQFVDSINCREIIADNPDDDHMDQVISKLVDIISPEALYDVIGYEDFEMMWLAFEKRRIRIDLSERQREIIEYLF